MVQNQDWKIEIFLFNSEPYAEMLFHFEFWPEENDANKKKIYC